MATTHNYKRKRQHRERKTSRLRKRVIRKSMLGEIDKTKEYTIFWLCNNITFQHDDWNISNEKLRGIVDYLRKISYIDDRKQANDQNVILVVDSTTLEKHYVQWTSSPQIRLIYFYQERDNNNSRMNRNELFVECPKVIY